MYVDFLKYETMERFFGKDFKFLSMKEPRVPMMTSIDTAARLPMASCSRNGSVV